MTTKTYKASMPVNLPLAEMVIGQDFPFTIYFKDDNRVAKNTTDWDMSIALRETNVNGNVIATLTVGDGITHTPSEGKFAVKVGKTITAVINVSEVVWDCKVTDANGDVTYPLKGTIAVSQAVTQ